MGFLLPSAYPTPLSTSLYSLPLISLFFNSPQTLSFSLLSSTIYSRSLHGFAPSIRLRCHCSVSLDQPDTPVNKRLVSGLQPAGSLQNSTTASSSSPRRLIIGGFFAALTIAAVGASSGAPNNLDDAETLSNIPQTLSATNCDSPSQKNCKKLRIQRPKSKKAESCTIKCVTTCIRGGNEGPFNIIRPLVVFKQGFRSRQYCLVECSDICNLLPNDDP